MATIRKRGDKYHVQIRKKGSRSLTRSFSTRADANAWARKVESEIERGVFLDTTEAQETTLAQALDRYATEILSTLSSNNRWLSKSKVLKTHLGRYPLSSLSSTEIAAYRDRRLQTVGPQTVKHELGLLGRVLKKCAHEWGIHLPRGVPQVQQPKLPQGRERRLEPKEEQRLLAALKDTPTVRAVVVFALETGMRRGEIAAMRWEHLDLRARTLQIPQTKTGVPRRIPLSWKAAQVLRTLPRRLDGHVFGIQPDSITQAFERACRRARKDYEQECKKDRRQPTPGFLQDLRFHDLRHEATSRFFEKGLSLMEVGSITGHRDLRMLNRYTHLRAEDLVARL